MCMTCYRHECAHALFTPYKSWANISSDDELRTYVNVLEDCRIDAKIQKQYQGLLKTTSMVLIFLTKQTSLVLKIKI
ncbi:MAG: hypothetical protein CM15mV25_0960 [uncultured marine virus]|nr:MAG: hypothetical protein CM15mV25_0960 [uncultured marine virus]